MVAKEKGSYNVYVFWGAESDYQALTMEMLDIINSEKVLKSMNISNMTLIIT